MNRPSQSIQPAVIWEIARDEWRYWRRSKVAMFALLIGLTFTVLAVVVSAMHAVEVEHQREHAQQQSEDAFISQPDRHPRRQFGLQRPCRLVAYGIELKAHGDLSAHPRSE